jgi:hypothetical protein
VPKSNRQRFCGVLCRFVGKSERDAARYGKNHRRLRLAWSGPVSTGTVPCARCGELIEPGDEWHLDHVRDGSRPSHAYCNTTEPLRRKPELDEQGNPVDERWSRDMYGRWARHSRVW